METNLDYNGHPCYAAFSLESYIGIPIYVDEKLYGTLNFSSTIPKNEGFSASDYTLVRLMGDWVGATIRKRRREKQILQQNEKLKEINEQQNQLYSIVSHDLKGSFTGLIGILDIIRDMVEDNKDTSFDVSYLDLAQNSSQAAYELLENMLDWLFFKSRNRAISEEDVRFRFAGL